MCEAEGGESNQDMILAMTKQQVIGLLVAQMKKQMMQDYEDKRSEWIGALSGIYLESKTADDILVKKDGEGILVSDVSPSDRASVTPLMVLKGDLPIFANLGVGAAKLAWQSQAVARVLTEELLLWWRHSSDDKGAQILDQGLEHVKLKNGTKNTIV